MTFSKSYPPTPIYNQSFHFPPSPPFSIKLPMSSLSTPANVSEEKNASQSFIQSGGQDVMVSGISSNEWAANRCVINQDIDFSTVENDLSSYSWTNLNTESRRNLDDFLATPIPISDDLETTFEDLRDCDNNFSKFALEFELGANDVTNID